MTEPVRITLARGDGIGPEITEAVLRILEASGAPLEIDEIEIGEKVYQRGITTGIPDDAWQILRRNRVLLKAPISTPQGGGYKSLNVTIRKSLGLFANVRQCKAYSPYVASPHPGLDMVIIRENEEDLYAGIEHKQTTESVQALKLVTRPGCESIVRYAFEYARAYGRKKVTCMTKDNIMKLSDGLFHRVFNEVAEEYPELKTDHQIIDIGAARVAAQPESLDVVVTLNLYGDILSDIAAQVAGSVGLAGSANIGFECAMFEAIHGSAPDIAGKGVANPSGMLNGAVMMLVHVGLAEHASKIRNAWMKTLEDGIHTPDIHRQGLGERSVSTSEFADAVIERLGQEPESLKPEVYEARPISFQLGEIPRKDKKLVGVDVFLDWCEAERNPEVLGEKVGALAGAELELKMISNRGVKVFPGGMPETFRTDHWRCRFYAGGKVDFGDVLALLGRMREADLDIIQVENLYDFDGQRAYSLGQGE
ncbi:MAG: NADP-dependent isocitrate dehydrogenase [Deltaproteobacteria bacterium]|nr:NADP-dependent isocitrate dehydrogenase [Deltaproteobacteria bacterium]